MERHIMIDPSDVKGILGGSPHLSAADAVVSVVPLSVSVPRLPHPGEWMYERLARSIIDFEKKLDASKEVGARLINFGPDEVISIDDVGYWGVDLIIFYGKNREGHPVELLQHISQVNVLLVAIPVQSDPPRRIGFILEAELKKAKKDAGEE
jgi:hypothetical protein